MNPFGGPKQSSAPADGVRPSLRPALLVLLACVLVGAAAVAWRAKIRVDEASSRARNELLAVSAGIELQLNRVTAAAEILGAAGTQGQGTISNFSKIAGEVLTNHPGLAYIAWAPRGITSEVFPQPVNQRAIGLNLLKDPTSAIAAGLAVRGRMPALAGPVRLQGGEAGFMALAPIYQRGRDGREAFWGLATASMRLEQLLERANMDQLWAKGYSYSLFAPPQGQQGQKVIAERALLSLDDGLQQSLRVQNLELRLALAPREGWISVGPIVADSVAVLVLAGLVCLILWLWGQSRQLALNSSAARQQLAQVLDTHERVKEELQLEKGRAEMAASELKQARQAQETIQKKLAELQLRFDHEEQSAKATGETLAARLKEAEAKAGELQVQLDGRTRASHEAKQAHQKELDELRGGQVRLQQETDQLRARLEAALRVQKEVTASRETRTQKDEATIAELKSQLQAANEAADKAAAAAAAKLQTVAERNRDLQAMLAEAEARLKDLTAPAPEAQTGPKPQPDPETPPTPAPEQEPAIPQPRRRASGAKAAARGGSDRINQMDLFGEQSRKEEPQTTAAEEDLPTGDLAVEAAEPVTDPPTESVAASVPVVEEAPVRHLPPPPPVKIAELRQAVHDIVPLLTDQDPGAKDCLKDNRTTFRSAFSSEGYVEFEQLVRSGEFSAALEHLKKAAKRHGIST